MGKYLTAEAILKANDLPYEDINVPEWGGIVRVRGATALEASEYSESMVVRKKTKNKEGDDDTEIEINPLNSQCKLVVRCVVDEDGNRIFKDEDAASLGKKNTRAVERVFRRVQELSGMTKKARDEIVKNSETGPAV